MGISKVDLVLNCLLFSEVVTCCFILGGLYGGNRQALEVLAVILAVETVASLVFEIKRWRIIKQMEE